MPSGPSLPCGSWYSGFRRTAGHVAERRAVSSKKSNRGYSLEALEDFRGLSTSKGHGETTGTDDLGLVLGEGLILRHEVSTIL